MVAIPQIISEEDFAAICAAAPLKAGIDNNDLYEDLIRVAFSYRDRKLQLQDGFSPREVRDIARKIGKFVRKQQAGIIERYSIETDVDESITWVPDWLQPLIENLEATALEADKLLPDLPVQTGRMDGIAFHRLVDDLATVFIRYTGLPVTAFTNADNDDDGSPRTSKFQDFSRASCVAFARDEVTDTFEKKVANALGRNKRNNALRAI